LSFQHNLKAKKTTERHGERNGLVKVADARRETEGKGAES